MIDVDTPQTDEALRAFAVAWLGAMKDYEDRRINSEQCLQAAVYAVLRRELSSDFLVFSEAVVQLSQAAQKVTGKRKTVTDLLVCYDGRLVLGVEIKFTPRVKPSRESIAKDVMSLSHLTNRHAVEEKARIEMPRFLETDGRVLKLRVLSQRKLVCAILCRYDSFDFSEQNFWDEHLPSTGFWAERDKMPMNFGLALALARPDGTAFPSFVGGPFERVAQKVSSVQVIDQSTTASA